MIKKLLIVAFISTFVLNVSACGKSATEKQAEADRQASKEYRENRRK